MERTIMGVFGNRDNAEAAISELRTMGINDSDISYIYVSDKGKTMTEDGKGEQVADGAAAGATTGAVVGALAGLVVANGILPGLGSLFVAGPLAAALGLSGAAATTAAGALTGAAAGGIVGALTGLGVDADEAKIYEERVRSGGILVTSRTTDAGAARAIFANNGADEIRDYSRS